MPIDEEFLAKQLEALRRLREQLLARLRQTEGAEAAFAAMLERLAGGGAREEG